MSQVYSALYKYSKLHRLIAVKYLYQMLQLILKVFVLTNVRNLFNTEEMAFSNYKQRETMQIVD